MQWILTLETKIRCNKLSVYMFSFGLGRLEASYGILLCLGARAEPQTQFCPALTLNTQKDFLMNLNTVSLPAAQSSARCWELAKLHTAHWQRMRGEKTQNIKETKDYSMLQSLGHPAQQLSTPPDIPLVSVRVAQVLLQHSWFPNMDTGLQRIHIHSHIELQLCWGQTFQISPMSLSAQSPIWQTCLFVGKTDHTF